MHKLGEDIWIHEDTHSMGGNELRLRMTIVKLTNGRLWIHSPTPFSDELKDLVDQIGQVQYLVAANNLHNLWLLDWYQRYPQATLVVSEGLPKKLTLPDGCVLMDDTFWNPWSEDLTHQLLFDVPFFNESVFLHNKSNSLIVTDIIQNYSDPLPDTMGARLIAHLFRLIGFKDLCIAPPMKFGFLRKDKTNFAEAIQVIDQWDFDKIIVTHGNIIDADANTVFYDLTKRFLAD